MSAVRALRRGLPLALAAMAHGCDLSTPPPTGVALPGTLENKDSLSVRLAGAIGDLAVAYGGNQDEIGLVVASGLLADELGATSTGVDAELDRRAAGTASDATNALYADLQRARASAEATVGAYDALDPHAIGGLYARNLAGYAYLLLAESFCDKIPFSTAAADGTTTYGGAESTAQVLDRAVDRFASTLAAAPSVVGDADSLAAQVTLARIGRARAFLDLARFADAGADAASILDGFSWPLEYSDFSSREVNGVSYHTWTSQEYSAADSEGVNGIGFVAARDPRVQVDTLVLQMPSEVPTQYRVAGAPILLASTVEARLILAEAQLREGDPDGSLAILNALRAGIRLTPLADAGTPDGRVGQLFRERAFWLWLTGHRLSDLRRLVHQYGRPADTVYPIGLYVGGPRSYGDQLDLGFNEVNNPRYDPAACDPTSP